MLFNLKNEFKFVTLMFNSVICKILLCHDAKIRAKIQSTKIFDFPYK